MASPDGVSSTSSDSNPCDEACIIEDVRSHEANHIKTTIYTYTCEACGKILREVTVVRRKFTCNRCFPRESNSSDHPRR